MGSGNPHPNSLANLRPPFARGNQIRRGTTNEWLGRANQLRDDLWKAATPDMRTKMAQAVWAFALGQAEEPVFDDEGVPVFCPDGSLKMRPLPPERRADMQKWGIDTLLKCLGGSFSFKSIEASVTAEITDVDERARRTARVLVEEGLGHMLPAPMRALIDAEPKEGA